MIVDLHVHWLFNTDFIGPRRVWERLVWNNAQQLHFSPTEAIAAILDPTGEKMIAAMDEAGIDVSVLLPLDQGVGFGEPPRTIDEQNLLHARLVEKHPDRLVSFFGIDPRREGYVTRFRTAVREWGFKGLKLYPPSGFLPIDDACRPFYEAAAELGVPVLFHCNEDSAKGPRNKGSRPDEIARAAGAFPGVKMIMAHAGGRTWWRDLLRVSTQVPNVCADLSGWQTGTFNMGGFYHVLGRMRDTMGIDRILFATDFPLFLGWMDSVKWVDILRSLPEMAAHHGTSFTRAEADAILGHNAVRLLGLS